MGKLKVVFLSEEYISYMVKHCYCFALKSPQNMSRPYILLPEKINGHNYCVPFTSPKPSDYVTNPDGSLSVRGDKLNRMRFVGLNPGTGKNELLFSLVIDRMVPAVESEMILCDFNKRVCSKKKQELLKQQLKCAEQKSECILSGAKLLHSVRTDLTNSTQKYMRIRERVTGCLDFKAAEEACLKYKEHLENGLSRQEILYTVSHLPDMIIEEKFPGGGSTLVAKTSEAQSAEQGAVGGGDSSKLQPQPQPKPQHKPQHKPLSLPPGSAWNKPLKFSSETKPPSDTKSAWDKPFTSGQSSYAAIVSGMTSLSLTDGAVGGARPKCPESVSQGNVRAAIVDARGRGRGVNQSHEQSRPKGRGRGRSQYTPTR